MKFYVKLPQNIRIMLEKQLEEYRREYSITKEESQALKEWVKEGKSPYDNAYGFCEEYGIPLDFVSAFRFEKKLSRMSHVRREKIFSKFVPVYNTENDDIEYIIPSLDEIEDEEDDDDTDVYDETVVEDYDLPF